MTLVMSQSMTPPGVKGGAYKHRCYTKKPPWITTMFNDETDDQSYMNQLNVLRALQRFGWLRTRDIAALVLRRWKRSKGISEKNTLPILRPEPAAQSEIRRAQRLIAKLRNKKLILSTDAPNGSRIHTLSEKGARVLQNEGVNASSGKDLIRDVHAAYFIHRTVSSEVAISAMLSGMRVSTEREISQGKWLGGLSGVLSKKPDVLIRNGKGCFWVEIERSRKNQRDYLGLIVWLSKLWKAALASTGRVPLPDEHELIAVVFVCTTVFQNKLRADLIEAGWTTRQIEQRLVFLTSLYNFRATQFY